MNQSPNDPTLKDYFTQDEARRWIRHLEKIVDKEKEYQKKIHERNAKLQERFVHFNKKSRRLEFQNEFLTKRVTQLEEFIRENGLEPPQAEPETVEIHKQKKEE